VDTPLPIVRISELDNLSQDLPTVQPNQVQLMKVLDIEAPANILALAAEVTRMIWRLSGWSSTNKMRLLMRPPLAAQRSPAA
jgi:hypothetical protein